MRKLAIFCIALLTTFSAHAQLDHTANLDQTARHKFTTTVKTNPFAMLWGEIPISSEYKICLESVTSKTQSVQIDISYLAENLVLLAMMDENSTNQNFELYTSGFRLQARYKFFGLDRLLRGTQDIYAPLGWYWGPHISYATAMFSDPKFIAHNYYFRGTQFNMNFMVGEQFAMGKFIFDIFGGLGYKRNFWIERAGIAHIRPFDTSELGPFYNSHLHILLGANIGIGY